MKLFLNRDDLDFDSASDATPTQTLSLSQTSELQDIPLKRALWNTTQSVSLFFVDNFAGGGGGGGGGGEAGDENEEVTRFSFLGFKGQWFPLNREPVNVLYEAAANPSDHQPVVGTRQGFGSGIGGAGDGGAAEGM